MLQFYLEDEITKEVRERVLINKIFQDFLWTVWTLYKEGCGEDYGNYGLDMYNRAKKNINKFRELKKGVNA